MIETGITISTNLPPTAELRDRVTYVKAEEIRYCDYQELLDYARSCGYTQQELNEDFGVTLMIAVGLMESKCLYYSINHPDHAAPLFIATLTQVGAFEGSCCMLRGFALDVAYDLMSAKEIHKAISSIFVAVTKGMKEAFKTDLAVCHVKATNEKTLNMWKFIGRRGRKHGYYVNLTDDPFTHGYKLVTLGVK